MTKEIIKVRIKSHQHQYAWYKDEIGSEYEVTDDGDFWWIKGRSTLNKNSFILKSDCEIISPTMKINIDPTKAQNFKPTT